MGALSRYTRWLHTSWPAGTVEALPESGLAGETTVPGLRIVGDLAGIPLLKFASDTGARAVQAILREDNFRVTPDDTVLDLVIIGGGVGGISAAIEAKKAGLRFEVFEGNAPFATIANFPRAKPIYTYPTGMRLSGGLDVAAHSKEELLETLERQRRAAGIEVSTARIERIERRGQQLIVHRADGRTIGARRVIAALGRSGEHRRLDLAGETLPKVFNRLHDPHDFAGKKALVVGGGDTALETAIALTAGGAHVTLSYRQPEFSRPKPENIASLSALQKDPRSEVTLAAASDE